MAAEQNVGRGGWSGYPLDFYDYCGAKKNGKKIESKLDMSVSYSDLHLTVEQKLK